MLMPSPAFISAEGVAFLLLSFRQFILVIRLNVTKIGCTSS